MNLKCQTCNSLYVYLSTLKNNSINLGFIDVVQHERPNFMQDRRLETVRLAEAGLVG